MSARTAKANGRKSLTRTKVEAASSDKRFRKIRGGGPGASVGQSQSFDTLSGGRRRAAPEPAAGQLPEEVLDGVHPRAGGRREMEDPSAMILQPICDGLVFVGGVVVQNGMHRKSAGTLPVDLAEERDDFLVPVALGVASDDLAVQVSMLK